MITSVDYLKTYSLNEWNELDIYLFKQNFEWREKLMEYLSFMQYKIVINDNKYYFMNVEMYMYKYNIL